jgi:signal transduction histidine kinase
MWAPSVRQAKFNNLQLRITLIFLLISLLPLGVLSVFAVRTADAVITSIVTNQLENMASEKQELLQRWLSERRADLEVVAGSAAVRSIDPERIAPYLELVRTQYGVYREFIVVDRQGKTVYKTDHDAAAADQSDAPWFREAMDGRTAMSEIQVEPESYDSVFYISTPIRDSDGNPQGAVRAAVRTASILVGVLRVSLGETGESYLVDREGTFLAHKQPRRILQENIAQSESFSSIFLGDLRKPIYTDYRGIAVLGASRPVAGTGWYVVVEQDRDEAFADSYHLTHNIYLVIGLTAGLAIGASWLLGYYVTAPIRRISDAARALAAGDFDNALRNAQTRRNDEIGLLYTAFGEMAGQLRERHTQLQQRVGLTEEELRKTDDRLQRTLLAAAHSERLADLGRLGSGVAHEIRTPLTSLKLFLQSCQEEMETSAEQSEDFQIAMRQILRIETTINHFLQFARPHEPVMSELDFARLVDDALEIVRPRAKQQGVRIERVLADRLPPVEGDLRQLGECLVNLMVNALEVMPDGGTLSISAFPDNLPSGEPARPGVRLEVSDTGPGIPDDDLAQLFEPFFTTKAAGAGLGLPMVQNTVQLHGGVVQVRTQLEVGTTFSIYLPAV